MGEWNWHDLGENLVTVRCKERCNKWVSAIAMTIKCIDGEAIECDKWLYINEDTGQT